MVRQRENDVWSSVRFAYIAVNMAISVQENFPQKENFVKCDWPTQIFRRKNILKLKIFNF
jgi:hypothetical protein